MSQIILTSFVTLFGLAFLFALIGRTVTGRYLPQQGRKAWDETTTNLIYFFWDHWLLAPLLGGLAGLVALKIIEGGFLFSAGGPIGDLPVVAKLLLALFVADFVGYWRHRLLHTKAFWPVHAVHHSDEDLTWLSLLRQHPIERLISVLLQVSILTLLGFPAWAIIANALVRMVYGHFQHMDLPWDYGPLKHVFVSPAMHRWHHAADEEARDKNFAVLFSVHDLMFGTFYVPGPCNARLGTGEPLYPADWPRQMLEPFRRYWLMAANARPRRRTVSGLR